QRLQQWPRVVELARRRQRTRFQQQQLGIVVDAEAGAVGGQIVDGRLIFLLSDISLEQGAGQSGVRIFREWLELLRCSFELTDIVERARHHHAVAGLVRAQLDGVARFDDGRAGLTLAQIIIRALGVLRCLLLVSLSLGRVAIAAAESDTQAERDGKAKFFHNGWRIFVVGSLMHGWARSINIAQRRRRGKGDSSDHSPGRGISYFFTRSYSVGRVMPSSFAAAEILLSASDSACLIAMRSASCLTKRRLIDSSETVFSARSIGVTFLPSHMMTARLIL